MDKIEQTLGMQTPLVSIIVPIYNAELTLGKCVDSLIGQTYRDIEILLIDDGSTDNSLQACREFAARDARVRVFSQENAGPAAARNVGLAEAKGDYIAFCDSDDWMTRPLIGTLVEQGGGADLIVSGITTDGYDGDEVPERAAVNGREAVIDYYLSHPGLGNPYGHGKLFRAEIIRQGRLRQPDLRLGEDSAFICRFLSHTESLAVVPIVGYHYCRANEGSLVSVPQPIDKLRRSVEVNIEAFEGLYAVHPSEVVARSASDYYYWAFFSRFAVPNTCGLRLPDVTSILRPQSQIVHISKVSGKTCRTFWSHGGGIIPLACVWWWKLRMMVRGVLLTIRRKTAFHSDRRQ